MVRMKYISLYHCCNIYIIIIVILYVSLYHCNIVILYHCNSQSTHRPSRTKEGTAAEGMVRVQEEGMYEDFISISATRVRVAPTHLVVVTEGNCSLQAELGWQLLSGLAGCSLRISAAVSAYSPLLSTLNY